MASREMIEDQAASKIIWGEREEEVIAFLKSQSFTQEDAEQAVRKAVRERDWAMRRSGVVKVILGSLMFIVCAGFAVFCLVVPSLKAKFAIGILIPGAIYGLVQVRDGFARITRGAREPGQVY